MNEPTKAIDITHMTRKQAEVFGKSFVDKLDALNCEYNSSDDWGDFYSAATDLPHGGMLIAMYYQEGGTRDIEDLSDLDWEIDHYTTSPDVDFDNYMTNWIAMRPVPTK